MKDKKKIYRIYSCRGCTSHLAARNSEKKIKCRLELFHVCILFPMRTFPWELSDEDNCLRHLVRPQTRRPMRQTLAGTAKTRYLNTSNSSCALSTRARKDKKLCCATVRIGCTQISGEFPCSDAAPAKLGH